MFLFIVFTLLTTRWIRAEEPPTVAAEYDRLIRIPSGRNVALTCPVLPNRSLIITWYKDDEQIVPEEWIRYRTTGGGSTLKISTAEPSDSGRYLCRAINGFGTVDVNISLIVDTGDANEEESSTVEDVQPISFTEETLSQPRNIEITAKSHVTIECSLIGYPHPDIVWLKDGLQYNGAADQQDQGDRMVSRYPLRFDRITSADGGQYTCLARHMKKQLNVTFSIRVLPGKFLKDLAYVLPESTTEVRGNPTALSCWVRSLIWPTVRWLKVTATSPHKLHPNTTVKVGNRQFQEVSSNETQHKEDGTFLRKLIIDSVTQDDAGIYFCMAQNPSGFTLSATELIVSDREPYRWELPKSVPLPVIVVLPSLLLLALMIGFVVWLRSRNEATSTDDTSATAAPLYLPSSVQQPRGSFQAVQSASPSLSNRKFANQQLFTMDHINNVHHLSKLHQISPV